MKFFKKDPKQSKHDQSEQLIPFEEEALAEEESEDVRGGEAEINGERPDDTGPALMPARRGGARRRERKASLPKFLSLFKKDKKHAFIYAAVILVFVAAGVTAIVLYNSRGNATQVSYENVAVSTRTINRTLTGAGEITYADTETVSFSTSKTFTALCVETQDAVSEGQKLAKYSDGSYLTADCDGVVSAISAPATGTVATSGNSITICPTDSVVLDITVPQDEISLVAKGDEADIIVNADTAATYAGAITYIGGAAQSSLSSSSTQDSSSSDNAGTNSGDSAASSAPAASGGNNSGGSSGSDSTSYFEVIITVANDGKLKLGMSASCTIMLESKADVIAVPIAAVFFDGDSRYVNVVGSDGSVTKTTVKTGISDANYVEVTSGLSGNETVQVETVG